MNNILNWPQACQVILCLLLLLIFDSKAKGGTLDHSAQCASDACRLRSAITIIRESRDLDVCDKDSVEQHFSEDETELAAVRDEAEHRFVGMRRLLDLRLTHYGSTQRVFKRCTLSFRPPDLRIGQSSSLRPLIQIGDLAKLIEICPIRSQNPQAHGPSIGAYKWCGELREKTLEVSFYFYDEVLNSVLIQREEK